MTLNNRVGSFLEEIYILRSSVMNEGDMMIMVWSKH